MLSGLSNSFKQEDEPALSVLLPTYKRVDALERTLRALEDQNASNDAYEVIVIDDGSQDGTETFLEQFSESTKIPLLLCQPGGERRACAGQKHRALGYVKAR